MIYRINKASNYGSPQTDCEEASLRTINTKFRDIEFWTVELNTIEELMNFATKYKSIIINTESENYPPELIIYDDYIE
jgi:predicted Rossmann fold nucleotide-binding protein DprA/Smf involved in DNA uptake